MTTLSDICGLDFGTSNSEIGVIRSGVPELVDVEEGRKKIPTTIFFDNDSRLDLFGERAIERFLEGHSGRMMWAIKSVLGTAIQNEATMIRGRRVAFEQIITRILSNLKQRADAAAGVELRAVVLGRPVHFNDDDPKLDREAEAILRRAARQAGFEEIEVELEPVAAGIEFETQLEREQLGLVVDIGGGTSDFSVIRLTPAARHAVAGGRERVLSVAGIHIGGTDFDRLLSVEKLMPELGLGSSYLDHQGQTLEMPQWVFHDLASWLRINFIYENRMLHGIYTIVDLNKHQNRRLARLGRILGGHYGHALARVIEGAKIELSDRQLVDVPLDLVERGLSLSITRHELEAAISAHLDQIERVLMQAVEDSGVSGPEIAVVFFTGGGSLLPEVRRRVRRLMPAAEQIDTDQFGGIARGLTIEAQRLFA
jgi:hypothetical chaperone protein